ncbi:Copper metallochaperone, bacterial Cox17-like protein [Thioalkalivibrio nitratireducens DSM 14787]|uniref:Copper metallochaperone, bacterial Cox17-like protein n=1 Tax=Thioalkalivibrio nitratireducens (strain DSM 14787 / UNIQEM 213 / ALEN2) TaxID=1255043 RepID=L0DU04_THIND|nr:copper chaperone PCu(A)C [Thioalkalivibrio nitratireducens]AGA32492.1 Copper metallochaperone, bacterial Cox17-like protein [Thioalkalivibrio nitratireducens DSM 14787]
MHLRSGSPGLLYSLVLVLATMGSPAVTAHHTPGHHGSAHADCDCPPGIELDAPAWVRLTPPGVPNSAAYMTLRNTTDADIRILAGESPAARVTELHDHVQDAEGVMRMRQVDAITIAAQDRIELRPGGLHVMLIDLVQPLSGGDTIPITLYIEAHEDLHLEAVVQSGGPSDHGHHHGHSDRGPEPAHGHRHHAPE